MVEGAPHTAKIMINVCVYGVPPPPYIKEWRRGAGPLYGAPWGSPFQVVVGALPSRSRRGRKEERGRKERGAGPPPNSDWAWGRPLPYSFPLRLNKAHIPPGGFR